MQPLEIIYIVFIFFLGLSVGSFINALEYRMSSKKSINGRSFCPKCKHQLAWFDLVPLFSWLALRGECRYCKKKISFQYPLIELLTGISFVAIAWRLNNTLKINLLLSGQMLPQKIFIPVILLVLTFLVASCFLLIALHDVKTKYVMQEPVYVALAAIVLYDAIIIFTGRNIVSDSMNYLIPGAVGFLFFYSLFFFSKGKWMGEGDAEIAGLIGLFLGSVGAVIAIYFAFILGSAYGLWLVFRKKAMMKSEIAFGQFLVIGAFIALAFGNIISSFYVRIFL